MFAVDKSLSFLNDMLHHPSVFKLDPKKQKYISKSTLNSQVRLDSTALSLPYPLVHYTSLQAKMHKNREFVLFLVFKLLERGVYISARNVAVVEKGTQTVEEETECITDNVQSNHNQTAERQHIVHCDVIAFHAKKRHIYTIVVCDNVTQLQKCRVHAQRVATNIRRINPCYSTVFPFVLTVYDFDDAGTMRLCAVPVPSKKRQKPPPSQSSSRQRAPI